MSAPPKDIIALTAKLQRAEEHIFKLQEFWREFRTDDTYPIRSQDTADGAYRMYSLGPVAPIPADVPLITGDAVHNLRSALDHVAYRLVCVGTNSPGPFDSVYFPTGKDAKKFKARIQAIDKWLRPEAIKELTNVEAYGGGQGEILWHIHYLDIIDKHRLLLTVTSLNRFHSMSPAEIARIRHQFAGVLANVPESNDPIMFLKSGTPRLSMEAGDVLDIFPIAEVHEKMEFPIEIAFGEPEIVKRKPVAEFLNQAASSVRRIITLWDSLGLFD